MKNIKKILFCIICLIVGIFVYNEKVYAADQRWPGVNSNSLPGEYANMEYCVYNTGDVYTLSSGLTSVGKNYNNTSFIFIYDMNSSEIKFLTKDNTVIRMFNDYVWDTSRNNQKIFFPDNLYNYMVDDRGIFSCKKLYFMEKSNGSLLSRTGSLAIETEQSLKDYNLNEWEKQVLENSSALGTRYGENIVTKCDDYSARFNEIANNYYEKNDILDKLEELANSDYQPGTAEKAKEYFDEFLTLYNQTKTGLESLKITTNENGNGFYINKCDGINTLADDYNKLQNGIDSYFRQGNWSFNRIQTKLNTAVNNGAASEEDKSTMEEVKEELETAQTEWREYKDNINLGKKIKDATCEGLLGTDLLDDISTILTWVRIAVPILLIILGSVDFATAVLSDDQQALKKASSKFVKRCVIAVGIFFIPSIIMYLLSFIDKIADVSCDIRLW